MCLGPKKALAAAAKTKAIEDKKPAAVVQPQTETVSAIPSLQPLPAAGSLAAITEGFAETAPTVVVPVPPVAVPTASSVAVASAVAVGTASFLAVQTEAEDLS